MTTVRGEEFEVDGKVSQAAVNFRVLEDGALAYQLQEQEYAGHYTGNITRNRTVRQDIRTAKDVAEDEALQAFREEHEQVERNREIFDLWRVQKGVTNVKAGSYERMDQLLGSFSEERDREAAKQLYQQMMKEEKEKAERKRVAQEEEDQDIAKRIQEHEKKKAALLRERQRASLDESTETDERAIRRRRQHQALVRQKLKAQMEEYDQDMAKRIQAHEERKAALLRQKRLEKDAALARKLSQSERPALPDTPGSSGTSSDINGVDRATASMSLYEEETPPMYSPPAPPSERPRSMPPVEAEPAYETPMDARARGQAVTMVLEDDDDRTNTQAEEDDEDIARKLQEEEVKRSKRNKNIAKRLQQEEIKRSRRNKNRPELSDDEMKRLQHDERIARKMQHEEVMIAKNKYQRYKERVDDEIASPEPMSHVGRGSKMAVSTDAKYDTGITLTDYKPTTEDAGRPTNESSNYTANGMNVNVAAAIDPTYSVPPDAGNVVLMNHKRSLNEGPPPGSAPDTLNHIEAEVDDNIAPIQGTHRKKESKKKKGFFSKLSTKKK